jgi:phage terminase Nu1 subunit (DNA packaging protein)
MLGFEGERRSSADLHVNLTELASVTGVSANTLRGMMRDHEDFPIVSRGSNGKDYTFDVEAVKAWMDALAERQAAANAARRDELAEMQASLFGDGPAADENGRVLTAKERREAIEAELAEIRLRSVKGELVQVADMEQTIEAAFQYLRGELLALPDAVARELELDRDARLRLDNLVNRTLRGFAERLATAEESDLAA